LTAIFVILTLALLLAAAITRQDFLFKLLYMLGGAFILGRVWSARAIRGVRFKRHFQSRAFPMEEVPVRLEIENKSWLPVVWLRVNEQLPLEISPARSIVQVVSVEPHGRATVEYKLAAGRRGYYPVGPLSLTSGDLLGFARDQREEAGGEHFTVYPRVIPLSGVRLPSHSPLGGLRTNQPVYEDPARPVGKRDYRSGDSMRRIDWKSTAATGRLQVRVFEPSIALETAIFLNLNVEEYYFKKRIDATELAVVAAASLANWVIGAKQPAGLYVNGRDPQGGDGKPAQISTRKGRAQLMRILESLARVQMGEVEPFAGFLAAQRGKLNWGSTLVAITGQADEALFQEFFQAQRAGVSVTLMLCGTASGVEEIQRRGKRYGIPVYAFWNETDLERWRP